MIVGRPTAVADQVIPATLRLEPPAPNPSSGAAAFRFAVARAGRVELALYDLVGRRVRTLIAGSVAAGAHDATWDGRDGEGLRVPAGLYYARLRMDGEIQSRCVVIER
jgi:flagellar hook assembly protein FlgD